MRILSYSPYDDTGGTGFLMASAFNAVAPWVTYNAVCGAPSYLQYPQHTPWSWPHIKKMWRDADVVHLHDGFHCTDGLPARPHVVTWHGTGFREQYHTCLGWQRAKGAVGLVATLDLWLLAPDDVTWMPAPFDLDWLAGFRRELQLDGVGGVDRPLRIGHCPTNRALKSTDAFLAAAERLNEELPVQVVLVEGKPWAEVLPIKATFDVYFDQTAYGYGQNSIEAWGMGIPVVCGAQPATLLEYERRFGTLPFVLADPGSIYDALRILAEPSTRMQWGWRGREHAQQFHSQQAGVNILTPIYEAL